MNTESLAEFWSRLRPTLLDETNKNRLVPEKVAALPIMQKVKAICYLISRRWPIVAELVDDIQIGFMQHEGYIPGFTNQLNNFWIRPEHKTMFQRIDPVTTAPVALELVAPEPPTARTRTKTRSNRERVINDKRATAEPVDSIKLVAEQIKELRIEKQMSGAELGKRISSNKHQISRLESGRYSPTFTSLDAIFRAMGKQIVGLELIDYVEPEQTDIKRI